MATVVIYLNLVFIYQGYEQPPSQMLAAWNAFNSRRSNFGKGPFRWSSQLAHAAQEGSNWDAANTAQGLSHIAHHDSGGRIARSGWQGDCSEGMFGGRSMIIQRPGQSPIATMGFPPRTPEYLAQEYADGMVWIGFGTRLRRGNMNEGHVEDYRGDWAYAGIGAAGGHFTVEYGSLDRDPPPLPILPLAPATPLYRMMQKLQPTPQPRLTPIPILPLELDNPLYRSMSQPAATVRAPVPIVSSLVSPTTKRVAVDVTAEAMRVLNAVRGLSMVAVKSDKRLVVAAMEQALYVADHRMLFGLHDQSGRSYETRLRSAGWPESYGWDSAEHAGVGQNSIQEVLSQWLIPPGRRRSLLGPTFDRIGAAKCDGPLGTVWMLTIGQTGEHGVYSGRSMAMLLDDDSKIRALRERMYLSDLVRDKRLDAMAKLGFNGYRPGMPHAWWVGQIAADWKAVTDLKWPLRDGDGAGPPGAVSTYKYTNGRVETHAWNLNISECGGPGMSLDQTLEFLSYDGTNRVQYDEPHRVTWRWRWTHYGLYVDPKGRGCWMTYGYDPSQRFLARNNVDL